MSLVSVCVQDTRAKKSVQTYRAADCVRDVEVLYNTYSLMLFYTFQSLPTYILPRNFASLSLSSSLLLSFTKTTLLPVLTAGLSRSEPPATYCMHITSEAVMGDVCVCVRYGTGDFPTRPSEPSHVTVDQHIAVAGILTTSSGSCRLAGTR